jgi:ATP-dependent Lhr-like helicase
MIHRDGVNRRLRGRRGARLAALTSGGAIPDTADYDVLLASDGTKIGKVGEDFAIDSSAGQTFLLGNTSWRIRRVETGKVWVEDAKGAPPSVPFWFGEAPARTQELSAEVASLRREIADHAAASREAGLGLAQAVDRIAAAYALDPAGARLACEYVEAGRAALGAVPTLDTLVAERFFDDAGGMQLVIHAPFGARINRGLGMALRKSFCRSFDFELQAAATDDGVLLSLGPQHSFPLESILELVRPDHLRDTLEQAALQSPMFATRFRWDAGRSLALLRFQNGKRVPPAIQRMRSEDLMAAVFPASLGCQDNHGGLGAHVALPDHPIVNEAIRDCLEELMDIDGLADVLARLRAGAITLVAVETPEPSVFSHEILNANPYAFLDDAPLEERRARAVSVRRGLPAAIVDRLGGLDPEAIAAVVREARTEISSADELHDRLLDLVALPEQEAVAQGWEGFFAALVRDRRAARLTLAALPDAGPPGVTWVAAERRSLALAIWNDAVFAPDLVAPAGSRGALPADREAAIVELVRARVALTGPITAAALGLRVDVPADDVTIALHRIELDGAVLRGRFTPGLPTGELEWCHRILLARIHRRTTDGLRRAIEPVSAADLMRFLFVWQGVRGAQPRGRAGLARVVEQLQGVEIAAGAWESEVLAARVMAYQASWLDELCFSGEVVWGRLSPRDSGGTPTRAAPITLARRRDLAWLLARRAARGPALVPAADDGLSPPARDVLTLLERDGASFLDEIVASAGHARIEIEDALWELVARGRITGDGFSGLRSLIEKSRPEPVWKIGRLRGGAAPVSAGRWSLLRPPRAASETSVDAVVESLARLYLRRYGVVFRDLLGRESDAPPWSELVRVYRVLEMRGEIRGGHLVQATVGEQFALPEALDALRAIRREPLKGDVVRLSACDPLNLVGVVTPGARVAAHLGNYVSFRDGVALSADEVEATLLTA